MSAGQSADGCLFCSSGCALCAPPGHPDSGWPEWFSVGSTTPKTWQRNVQAGLHPLGFALGAEGTSCGTCSSRYVVQRAKRYQNCRKVQRTGGEATDVRVGWRGCRHWAGVEG